ncbi:MAG: helix-turn-helix domain-containing protein [bacterium]|nr:helix-turn-helix domain-containing protein [bacterium]
MIEAATTGVSRRADLGAFLRVRRAALRPSDVGLAENLRRHVPGLRREEVAALAGISTTWYTWIEQGREINMSPDVLEQIGEALRLRPHEVEYIKMLANDTTPLQCTLDPEVPDALRTLVESHTAAPAYIATPRFDMLVWNEFVSTIFGYSRDADEFSRNILWRMFYDPKRRDLYADWEGAARATVASFRHNYAQYRGDVHFERLLETMKAHPEFAKMWAMWEIQAPGLPPFKIKHPSLGLIELETIQASLGIAPGCYLVIFSSNKLS